jgi:16S rRNA (guanine527-N7)-methyltransferase
MTVEKNKVMNLTAITEFEEFVMKHYVDSLSIINVIDLKDKNYSLIDIGTGAGFPGIPLKIMFPELDITLFDSLQKRLAFLDDVIRELGLKKIVTVHGRAEEFGRKLDYREKYDIVVSRAVAELTPLCELALPFCKVGGRFISYKGGKGSEELKNAEYAIKELGGKKGTFCEYTFDTNDATNERTLIEICKVKNTSSKYPRGGGKPFKAPLHMV